MSAQRFALAAISLLVAQPSLAGTGRQVTTFLVEAEPRAVADWIAHNSRAIDESTGAEVLAVRGPQAELRKETKEGTFTFNVRHDPGRGGKFRTVLLKSDNPHLESQVTNIEVRREDEGTRVTISIVATVDNHSNMAISLGIRPSLRGIRRLLEDRFGSPNQPP